MVHEKSVLALGAGICGVVGGDLATPTSFSGTPNHSQVLAARKITLEVRCGMT